MKPKSGTAARTLTLKSFLLLYCCLSIAPATLAAAASGDHTYGLRYTLKPDPATGSVQVVLTLSQDTQLLRAMSFASRRVTDLAGDGNHYAATVTAEEFRGLNRVRQHQLVYAALKGKMEGSRGELHALALTTRVPE